MDLHNLLVITPPGHSEPGAVIAACRAGALGFLDFESVSSPSQVKPTLDKALGYCQGPFGVKLGRNSDDLIPLVEGVASSTLSAVLLAGGEHPHARDWAQRFQKIGLKVFWEAVSVEEMHLGHRLGADGLILKGHEAGGRVGEETTFVLLQRWRAEFGPQAQHHLPAWVQGGIGLNSAAASVAAGALGVVLDYQLLLAKESPSSKGRQNLVIRV